MDRVINFGDSEQGAAKNTITNNYSTRTELALDMLVLMSLQEESLPQRQRIAGVLECRCKKEQFSSASAY